MADQKIMKDLGLNDEIMITAPVHVWLSAMNGYTETDWNNTSMNTLLVKVQEALFDHNFLSERLAAHQLQHDMAEDMIKRFTGQPPDLPPNYEVPEP